MMQEAPMASLLAPDTLRAINTIFRLPDEALDDILIIAECVSKDEELTKDLFGIYQRLCAHELGRIVVGDEVWARSRARVGDDRRMIGALALYIAGPSLVGHNAAKGFPAHIAVDSLADLGVWMLDHKARYGTWGLTEIAFPWITNHFTGRLYGIGRLQFERSAMGEDATVISKVDGRSIEFPKDAGVLGMHIPAGPGMTPEACGDSVRKAMAFFTAFFPEFSFIGFHCGSWLLDPTLARLLPRTSNIARFQDPFFIYRTLEETEAAWDRVFQCVPGDLNAAPRDTTLRRVMLDHALTGGKFGAGFGLVPCDDAQLWEKIAAPAAKKEESRRPIMNINLGTG